MHNGGQQAAHNAAPHESATAPYPHAHALSDYVRSRITNREEPYYVLLDEVQYAISDEEMRGEEPPRLYGVLNGLLRMRNVDVYVTGSNSKMLSTNVMTEFRGRGDEVRVRPLSFAEFMQAYDGDVQHGWAEYVMFGGMPLTLSMRSDEQKSLYLKNLFEETYLKDIVSRNGLRRSQELDDLVDVLASSIGALTNPPKIKATFASVLHSGISTNTIMQYIGHLEDAFVIEEARRFDVKGRKYIGSPKKYYFEDMGLRNARLGFCQIEQTHIMENIVYNELRTRGYNVDVGVVDRRGTSEGVPYRKRLEVRGEPRQPALLHSIRIPTAHTGEGRAGEGLAARDRRQLPEDRPRTRRGQTRPRRTRHPHDERLRFPPQPGQPDDVTPDGRQMPRNAAPPHSSNTALAGSSDRCNT